MHNLTDTDVAEMLFAGGRVELVDADDLGIAVTRRWAADGWVRVTAPRLLLEHGLRLTGQVVTAPGVPWSVEFEVDSVWQIAPGQDEADLRIVGASVYPERRGAVRAQAGGAVSITAHYATELVSSRRHPGELEVLSELGCAVSCREPFSVGDRLTLSARGLMGRIEGEIQVVSVRPGDHSQVTIHGGRFVTLDDEGLGTIRRIVAAALDEPD